MGLKIKFWTNQVVTVDETEAPKTKRVRKTPAKKVTGWTEVTVEASALGITEEAWDNGSAETILKAIPGINTEFGVGAIRYQ